MINIKDGSAPNLNAYSPCFSCYRIVVHTWYILYRRTRSHVEHDAGVIRWFHKCLLNLTLLISPVKRKTSAGGGGTCSPPFRSALALPLWSKARGTREYEMFRHLITYQPDTWNCRRLPKRNCLFRKCFSGRVPKVSWSANFVRCTNNAACKHVLFASHHLLAWNLFASRLIWECHLQGHPDSVNASSTAVCVHRKDRGMHDIGKKGSEASLIRHHNATDTFSGTIFSRCIAEKRFIRNETQLLKKLVTVLREATPCIYIVREQFNLKYS